ncbi:unknown [Cryptophlebia leucotreta granulovirus]|uniref:Uncharacterized protein n=1 Tax=Cryptophlebia leucotreta granulosis virus TaxID=35254 RepID=Q7T5P3_GVCL|nr:hypothetical protein [Cryptophlebia leucotreta granulovirus]AAQ21641.1 unknown [Cryptophlebia leucotreta granulovirus]AUF82075.1 hypothetical protein [Cryptophlebia leucotreta granulovirus]
MDKKVDLVFEQYNNWSNEICKKYHDDRVINLLMDQLDDKVMDYLDKKRKKYIKIENFNKIINGNNDDDKNLTKTIKFNLINGIP